MKIIPALHPHGLSDTITVLRARVFLISLISFTLFSIAAGTYYITLVAQDESSSKLLLFMTVSTCFLFVVGMLSCQFTGQISITGHVQLLWLYLIQMSMYGFIGGGPSYATSTPLILISCYLAFSSTGLRGGLGWSCLYTASYMALVAAEIQGFRFSQLVHSDHLELNRFVMWCLVFPVLILCLSAYEWMIATLANEHGGNYSKLHKKYNTDTISRQQVDYSIFEDYLRQAVNRNAHYGDMLSLIFVDVKIIANNLQEDLINEACDRIEYQLRTTDTLIRVGKSRLAIICENIPAEETHQLISNDIESAIMQPYFIEGFSVDFTPRVKSTLYPKDANHTAGLLDKVT